MVGQTLKCLPNWVADVTAPAPCCSFAAVDAVDAALAVAGVAHADVVVTILVEGVMVVVSLNWQFSFFVEYFAVVVAVAVATAVFTVVVTLAVVVAVVLVLLF